MASAKERLVESFRRLDPGGTGAIPRPVFEGVLREACGASAASLSAASLDVALPRMGATEIRYEEFFDWVFGEVSLAECETAAGAVGACRSLGHLSVGTDADGIMDHMMSAPGKLKPYTHQFSDAAHRRQAMEIRQQKVVQRVEPNGGTDTTKKVLMVIDVMDGYDAAFLDSLGDDVPGGAKYIMKQHNVAHAYELKSRKQVHTFAHGEKSINYNKGWNRGLDANSIQEVVARAIREIRSGKYSLVVFTKDYLEPAEDGGGVFPLDKEPWSNPKKAVALVPHSEFLTFTTEGTGADVHRDIRKAFPGLTTNGSNHSSEVGGIPMIVLRKQVDDAFNDETERSLRTHGEAWLDDIDVGIDGKPRRNAETCLQKLLKLGYGPDEACLSFMGIVTNRCVASSLIHSVTHGYQTELIVGGTRAATEKDHAAGLQMIREECSDSVVFVD